MRPPVRRWSSPRGPRDGCGTRWPRRPVAPRRSPWLRAATPSTRMPEPPPDGRRRRVTALRYEGEGAPKVVASGQGHVAEKILAAAQAAGVPVRDDPHLAAALGGLALGQEVPED